MAKQKVSTKNKETKIDTSVYKLSDEELLDILVHNGYIESKDGENATKVLKTGQIGLLDYLLSNQLVSKDLLGQALAEYFRVSYADLNSNQPHSEQVLKIPEEIAINNRLILFKETQKTINVTTDLPDVDLAREILSPIFPKHKITVSYSLSEDIDQALLNYQRPLGTRFAEIIEAQGRIAPEMLDEIFHDAYVFSASDIHFEPQTDEVIIRFRVDGVLHEAGRLLVQYYENILNRIKIQSNIRIDEHFKAQDGAMSYEKGSVKFDIRTSIVPTVAGEKVVLRLLATYVQGLTLSDIGLSSENHKILEKSSKRPFGMILVTGPTGSGKTTTLYSTLKLLLKPEANITTIEDPVEYKMKGANQIQVNEVTGLTFSRGLRSIVRQDPDVILVGEIRDEETAEIAVNAALTGHLLLSTFHANDAATAVPRLLDMNIEPFLLASTLELIVAQRLVRKICDSCRYSKVVKKSELENIQSGIKKYFPEQKVTLYAGKGCGVCGHTGYKGRTGIFEFIRITPEMQDLILTGPSSQEIWKLARKQKSRILFEDGIDKVRSGITTVEELLRVAPPF